MKLTIGEKWHKTEHGVTEELEVTGLDSIEDNLEAEQVVLPVSGDSYIEVKITASDSPNWVHTKVRLRHLAGDSSPWQRGEAPEMPGMIA